MEHFLRGFKKVIQKKNTAITCMPLRATRTSAGYDFYTPNKLIIYPQQKLLFWTDVKAYMLEGEVLLLDVRSSMGIKNDLILANTIGVIDSDYYDNPQNEGNIGICLRNLKQEMSLEGYNQILIHDTQVTIPIIKDLRNENTVVIEAGERVAQGIFVKYLPSDNCNSENDRLGGIGSTTGVK